MNRLVHPSNGLAGLTAILLIALFAAGCATRKINWAARVGNYTYDQAVLELGPPDKQATLKDETVVAEWLVQRGYAYRSPAYGYYPGYYYGPVYPSYVDGYSPDYFLRLTFGADGRLTNWKSFPR